MLNIGAPAPDFSAPDQNGVEHKLAAYRGRWILLYFYPRDNTPGCTAEACAFRDNYEALSGAGLAVLGVSTDSVASHEKFAKQFHLPFPLLSDGDKKIVSAYGADGAVKRISYLIGPDGKIAKAYPRVKPEEHAAEIKRDLTQYSN